MAQFEHITIIGLGLIGGSFAMALRAAGFDGRITGWDSPENLAYALEAMIIDAPEESFARGQVCPADLVYLAAPISAIIELLRAHRDQFKAGALVTDCGSTKRAICTMAEGLPPEVAFIGGHPMAGSEARGGRAARPDLFQSAVYLLVPRAGTSEEQILALELLLRTMGARPRRITAELHDEAVAMISHLPQLLSTALVSVVVAHGDRRAEIDATELAGPGYRDMSRLAASSWQVWRDICATNRDYIGAALDDTITILSALRTALEDEGMEQLGAQFARAHTALTGK